MIFILSLLMFACEPATTTQPATELRQPLNQLLEKESINADDLVIEISKQELKLNVIYDNCTMRSYPVVLGGNPVDDKLKQGDLCTPEGEFGIRNMYPHDRWTYFIWIDYPNEQSWEKHNAAKADGLIPDNANIGGEIGIHGVPEGEDYLIEEQQHWTLGCIALTTADITDLFEGISNNTRIVIE